MGEAADPTAFEIWICPTCGGFHKNMLELSGCCLIEWQRSQAEQAEIEADDGDEFDTDWG